MPDDEQGNSLITSPQSAVVRNAGYQREAEDAEAIPSECALGG
jgi:hypothetical protein